MDFCYYVHRSVIDEDTLRLLDTTLANFHRDRQVFIDTGVREHFVLPRQHSLDHYRWNIQMFGALNGLCSSITESKHIKAVKKPWRRSSRWKALGQMLLINQRLDKLAASKVDFIDRGMLRGPTTGTPINLAGCTPTLADGIPIPEPVPLDECDAEDDAGAVDHDMFEGEVMLARTPGMFQSKSHLFTV